jgi:methylated-DNA-[protein]-cysteine S-methyltransferase
MVTRFQDRVYESTRLVPKGYVTTYGAIARKLKCKAYRAVGQALNRNPYAPRVPCHRVVNSDGSIGGFASGTAKKIRMLKQEGVSVRNNRIVDFEKRLFTF